MSAPQEIIDLCASCVTAVKKTVGVELDFTQDTLPLLDHYALQAGDARDETLALVISITGAYFGEVVRRALDEHASWKLDAAPANWRLSFEQVGLSFNPLGMALEVISREDVADWGAHLHVPARAKADLERAMEVYGLDRNEDYYRFSVRFEAIEQAHTALAARSR